MIVNPDTANELPDGEVGEIWLQGNNIGRGYWGLPDETRASFGAELRSRLAEGSHAAGSTVDGAWLRTGDLGVYLDGELYVTGRIADLVSIDGRNHYPQDIEATVAEASPVVRRGYVTAFSDRPTKRPTAGHRRRTCCGHQPCVDPQPPIDAIRQAVLHRHHLDVRDVRLLPAGAIPRTTSGKLARRACRAEYLNGTLGVR